MIGQTGFCCQITCSGAALTMPSRSMTLTRKHAMTGVWSWKKGRCIPQRHGTLGKGTSGEPPVLSLQPTGEVSRIQGMHGSPIALPQTVSPTPWRRYFRPNEGHMVQGLAPAGCSYLAGKPLDFRQRAQQHMQRPERVDHAQPGIAYRAAVAEDLQYATEWTCVSIACHDFDPQTPFHLLGVGMQATLRMNRGGRPSSIATWPGSITSCSLPR